MKKRRTGLSRTNPFRFRVYGSPFSPSASLYMERREYEKEEDSVSWEERRPQRARTHACLRGGCLVGGSVASSSSDIVTVALKGRFLSLHVTFTACTVYARIFWLLCSL